MHPTRNISQKLSMLVRKLGARHDRNSGYELLGVMNNNINSSSEGAKATTRKKGCVVVCVGEEEKRYQVPVQYLSHPAFLQLLKQSQEDPDDKIDGPIKILRSPDFFDHFFDHFLKAVKADFAHPKTCTSPTTCLFPDLITVPPLINYWINVGVA
ncbi:hypothetical protein Tsubulata_000552 [Turnera subulata]|uniref:Uncharacterized protein n=1 Tax=Turnera subulata TaxID=218843 RepID=A0A9Q0FMV5_9ROSI|nr:hypothetical protein Tsubulata_000552 [Turnera subulata]